MYSLKINQRASVEENLTNILSQSLIVDIETRSFYPNGDEINIQSDFDNYLKYATICWIGFYSYKYHKTFTYNVVNPSSSALQEFTISQLLVEHNVLIGFN